MKQKIVLIIIGNNHFCHSGGRNVVTVKTGRGGSRKSDQAKAFVTETNHDWGEIKIDGERQKRFS